MAEYAIIVLPPGEAIEKVDKLRRKFAKYTSYVIPPHLTVYPPFYNQLSSEQVLIETLEEAFSISQPTSVNLKNFGFFEGKNNVAFIEPDDKSSIFLVDLLVTATNCLSGKAKNVYDDYNFSPENFKPHMTVAEKIPDDTFEQVKKELKNLNIDFSFPVSSVYLYGQDEGSKIWNKVAEINLKS